MIESVYYRVIESVYYRVIESVYYSVYDRLVHDIAATCTVALGIHDNAINIFSFIVNLLPVTATTANVSLNSNPTLTISIALPIV